MTTVLAGQTQDYRYDPESREMRPASEVEAGEVFTLRTLDFWAWDRTRSETDTTKQFRLTLEEGLVAIDGDVEAAKAFIEHPKVRLANRLYTTIVELALGN